MVKYSCELCGKEFSQKSHYDSHKKRKTPCENNADKIKQMVDKAVEEKLKEMNKEKLIYESKANTENKMSEPLKLLSLFTGIGGMDMGFDGEVVVHQDSIKNKEFVDKEYNLEDFVILKRNNFKSVFQNDILEGAKEVFNFNNKSDDYNTKSIYDLISENYKFPEADVVVGGFPCQDFSHCGSRKGFGSDKGHDLKEKVDNEKQNSRGTLYKSFVEVVKIVKPKVFVAENVYGLLTMKNEPIKQIVADFEKLGYDVQYQVIYCPEFGIPQTRKRVIIMGVSKDRKTDIPEDWNIITKNKTTCNIGKYFKHLEEPDETADVSQQMYSKAKKLSKGQGQTEVNMESFAPTMRAEHHGNIEFRRHEDSKLNKSECHLPERRLTVREAALIQTFPPDYVFSKKKNMKAYKYIGNAVPPLLGYLIADKVHGLCKSYFD